MTVTYEHYLWNGTDAYRNLPGGATSEIRIRKLLDGVEIANIDKDMNTAVLESMTTAEAQKIVDKMIDQDERMDTQELNRQNAVAAPIKTSVNDKLKAVTLKDRVGPYVDMSVEIKG